MGPGAAGGSPGGGRVVCCSRGGTDAGDGSLLSAYWPRVRHFIGGYASGCALVLAGHPFDTIKVRVQTAAPGQFKGPLDCLKTTIRREGLAAVYKGVTPPLLATGVINSVLFGIQGWFVHRIAAQRQGAAAVGAADITPEVHEVCAAAILSGACISLLVAPMEGVKARLQVSYAAKGQKGAYNGPIDCVRKLVAGPLGFRHGLYRGWVPTMLCRMSNYAYFGSYEFIRRALTPVGPDGKPQKPPLLNSVAAGGLSGFCYWISCYPVDVIKNRIQAAPDTIPPTYKGMRGAARAIYQEAGVAGFFKGFAPCVLRAFPANAACFMAFEVVMKLLPTSL